MSQSLEVPPRPEEVLDEDRIAYQAMADLSDEDYAKLAADIRDRGVLNTILLDEDGTILDGHHREAITQHYELDGSRAPTYLRIGDLESDEEKWARAIKQNLLGRDTTDAVKRQAVENYIKAVWPRDEESGALVKKESQSEVADNLGVSDALVSDVFRKFTGEIIKHDRLKAREYYRENPDASYREVSRQVDASNATVTSWLKEDFDEGDEEDENQEPLNLFAKTKAESEEQQELLDKATNNESDEEIRETADENLEEVAKRKTPTTKARKRVDNEIERNEAKQRREEKREEFKQSDDDAIAVHHGDFVEILEEFDGDVDHIITDPPYDEDALEQWNALGEAAARLLPDDGFLVAYSGKAHLPAIYDVLTDHLDYYWQFMVHHQGPGAKIFSRTLRTNYKPILVFTPKSESLPERDQFVSDVIDGDGMEKDDHDWQQAEAETATLVEGFSDPNDHIVDPMAGSGTTGVVCKRLDRRCTLIDRDPEAIDAIERRCFDE